MEYTLRTLLSLLIAVPQHSLWVIIIQALILTPLFKRPMGVSTLLTSPRLTTQEEVIPIILTSLPLAVIIMGIQTRRDKIISLIWVIMH